MFTDKRPRPAAWLVFSTLALSGCSGVQSTLSPGGREAEQIAQLFWWMTGGSLLIWAVVIGLAVAAFRANPDRDRRHLARRLIVTGAVFPSVVLAGLLIYGLALLPAMTTPAPEGSLRVSVFGERWWWRMRYEPPGQPAFEIANELWLPVGEPVEFALQSFNVIHSFWIPSLGGKVDLIPGRVNRLVLHPTRIGAYRGVCAEFCGREHAHMAFQAKVVSRRDFDQWLAQRQRQVP